MKLIFKSILLFHYILIIYSMIVLSKYFLMFLISIEFLVVMNLGMMLILEMSHIDWFFIFIIIMSVCEAVLGLSILSSMMFLMNKENIMLMNLKC
uniref:NADH dehydrogenase subunit 4L n=1 Tax=Megachile sculpturalis TaxID=1004196 RepID=A0A0M4KSW1_9HYME|nr:NADH dehydrogenase subunit 4L [Megachile sculpturalis]